MQLKLRPELLNLEKVSYASDHIDLPEGGIDCGEGCTPYGFPPEMLKAAEQFDMNSVVQVFGISTIDSKCDFIS